jgi:hypothetical protein
VYRNSQDLTDKLVRIAHKIMDSGNSQDGEEVLDLAHQVASRSLRGNVPPNDLMTSLDGLLSAHGIKWAVIGAIAVFVHGTPRDTLDIDVLVSAMPDAAKLADPRHMEQFGFYRAKSSTGTVLTVDHRQSGQVELLLANDSLRQAAIASAQPEMILGRQVPVVDAAHLIALKASSWTANPARGGKDRTDIVSVWEKSRPDLSSVLGLLSDAELANLKKAIPDAFEEKP